MARTLARFTVPDFGSFIQVFGAMDVYLREHGGCGAQVFQDEKDRHKVILLAEWNTLDDARHFYESAKFREASKRAGTKGAPEITYLREAERVPA
jgi:heme-degrading monooxygenase HmoA